MTHFYWIAVVTVAISSLILIATPARAMPGRATSSALEECARIAARGERIACFDEATRDVAAVASPSTHAGAGAPVPDIVRWVQAIEATRSPNDHAFLLSRFGESGSAAGDPLVIAAPALDPRRSRSFLVISCVSRITRLQIIPDRPMARGKATISLRMDEGREGPPSVWQVRDAGVLVDAGRGLPAIDAIRTIGQGGRLYVSSNDALLNGLVFDAAGLTGLIAEQRKVCQW